MSSTPDDSSPVGKKEVGFSNDHPAPDQAPNASPAARYNLVFGK